MTFVCHAVGRISWPYTLPVFFCGILTLFFSGIARADASAVITIGDSQGNIGDDVSISISLLTNGTQPSAISFEILFDDQSLAFKSSSPGAAALKAGKEVDANVAADGSLHVLMFGGTTVIGDGTLMTLVFTILSAGGESVPLHGDDLSISDPNAAVISGTFMDGAIQGDCVAPSAPTDVAASQGKPDGVEVSWSPVDGATAYRVYRRDPATPADMAPVSDWLANVTSFVDTTAAAPTAGGAGCFGSGAPADVTYEYLVRAQNDAGCASAFSAPAQGYRGAAATSSKRELTGMALPASASLATVMPALSVFPFLGDMISWVAAMGVLALFARRRPVMNIRAISTLKLGFWKR